MTTHIGAKTKRDLQVRVAMLEQQVNLCQAVNRNHERDSRNLREIIQRLEAALKTIRRIAELP